MHQDPSAKIQQLVAKHKPGYALARDFYHDSDLYQAELKKLFFKHWLYAGHVSQIPQVGDYFTFELDNESVLITRSAENQIKAFLNVCRHRGSRICLNRSGSKKHFVCPYHAWHYKLDGSLIAARNMPDDFEVGEFNLHEVNLTLIGGLIFISLAVKPLGLDAIHKKLGGILDLYGFETMKLAHKQVYPMAANWKLAVENYQECYHCGPAHPEFAKLHAMAKSPRHFSRVKQQYWDKHPNDPKFQQHDYYFAKAASGQEGFQYDHNPLNNKMLTGSVDGQAVAPLLGKLKRYTGGASELMLGPLSYFLIYDDYMVAYQFLPCSVNSCVCEVSWFVKDSAVQGRDYQLEALTWLWDQTTEADKSIIMNNKLGVDSHFYQPGPLSQMESFQQGFLNWYLLALN
ncbi:aromatic ring-hydroxylating oxygenase subunit alpha [Paraglaciecola aestuariivivens]